MLKNDKVVVYVHGRGGSAKEAEYYKPLFETYDVIGLAYESKTPWEAKKELLELFNKLSVGYKSVVLIANSIGAYFAMCALSDAKVDKAFFISPVVDMERLINKMMFWANVTEKQLEKAGTIDTAFGETLSYEYLCYVKENPVCWKISTHILYGERDYLVSKDEISDFAVKNNFSLTVMKNGEHYFHTNEQMKFLNEWIAKCAK